MSYRNKKLLASARDQRCTICGGKDGVVACHANSVALGKGTGSKAPDYYTAWMCQVCHALYDGRAGRLTKAEKEDMWTVAYIRTVAQWFEQGIIGVM